MDGWTKVILASVVMALAIVGFNISVWRRLRQASREAAALKRESE